MELILWILGALQRELVSVVAALLSVTLLLGPVAFVAGRYERNTRITEQGIVKPPRRPYVLGWLVLQSVSLWFYFSFYQISRALFAWSNRGLGY